LLQGWNSLLVRPKPLLNKDIKVQVNKQKPGYVCPARMKHNSDKMTIAPMSSSGARILPQAGFLMPDNLPGLRPAAYHPHQQHTISKYKYLPANRNEMLAYGWL